MSKYVPRASVGMALIGRKCIERVGVHVVGTGHLRVGNDERREASVERQHRLQAARHSAASQADGVVGESDDDTPGSVEVVLAHAVVAERVAIAVELEPVELDGDDVLAAGDLVVEAVVPAGHLDLALRRDA